MEPFNVWSALICPSLAIPITPWLDLVQILYKEINQISTTPQDDLLRDLDKELNQWASEKPAKRGGQAPKSLWDELEMIGEVGGGSVLHGNV